MIPKDRGFYGWIALKDIQNLVEEHFLKGRPVKKLMFKPPEEKIPLPLLSDIPFFKKQLLIVLRNKGIIDPEKIGDYLARDGYLGIEKALTTMTPEDVAHEIARSGLRGRGGAGLSGDLRHALCLRPDRPTGRDHLGSDVRLRRSTDRL